MSEMIAFESQVLLPFITDRNGVKRPQQVLAVLKFPSAEIATTFINTGSDPELKPVTTETMGDTTMGPGINYDVSAHISNYETGEVTARIGRYTAGNPEATAELSEFISSVTEKMLESTR